MPRTIHRAATLAALVVLAACSSQGGDEPRAASDVASSPSGGNDYVVMDDLHRNSPGRWAITAFGDPEAPMPVFDVPRGFQGHESWVWTDDGGPEEFGQLAYWTPTRVLTDPCDTRTATRPSPGVEGLAAALAAQRQTSATAPVPVTVDGHHGLYLELVTPNRPDPRRCAEGTPLIIFQAGTEADREIDTASIDRYWILELDGRRVVITALTQRGPDKATVDQLTGLVESARFVPAS